MSRKTTANDCQSHIWTWIVHQARAIRDRCGMVSSATADTGQALGVSMAHLPKTRAIRNLLGSSTLTLHWNGAAWSLIPSPNPGTTNNFLYGVTALASNDVWDVGRRASSSSFPGTLTMRWDGARWSVVASPNQASASGQMVSNELRAVSAGAANDVWAVGASGNQTLTLHLNGVSWSVISSPNVLYRENFLNGVVVVAANDVWAVGYYQDSWYETLIERFRCQ
jgi:hypothetical protein